MLRKGIPIKCLKIYKTFNNHDRYNLRLLWTLKFAKVISEWDRFTDTKVKQAGSSLYSRFFELEIELSPSEIKIYYFPCTFMDVHKYW
jgi:hypothetical protein